MLLNRLLRRQPRTAAFGYAVVGLGHIAEFFLGTLRDSPHCRVTAVVSGDAEKARRTARKYGVPRALTYAEFETLNEDSQVNGVYLALPVTRHRDFTLRSAAAGKHILCEKPMAATVEDAQVMVDQCRAAGVLLSIAYRCPYTVVHQRARDLVSSGALGPKESLRIESGFGFPLKPGWRDNAALAGGGSLYDVGIYPLNAARYLLGEDPVDIRDAHAVCDSNGLERSISWTSAFPSGALLRGRSSYRELIPDTLHIVGSRGTLQLAPAFSHRERLALRAEYRDDAGNTVSIDERMPARSVSQFRLEAEDLAHAAQTGTKLTTPGEDGLADMVAMQSIYRAAGVALTSAGRLDASA